MSASDSEHEEEVLDLSHVSTGVLSWNCITVIALCQSLPVQPFRGPKLAYWLVCNRSHHVWLLG